MTEFDPDDIVAEGLTIAAEKCGDSSLGKDGAALYAEVRPAVISELRTGDKALVALPSLNMSARVPAFLLVLEDRAILAWSKGMFRPKVSVEIVALDDVSEAVVASGTGANRSATFLTVRLATGESWELALPSNTKEFVDLVTTSFVGH